MQIAQVIAVDIATENHMHASFLLLLPFSETDCTVTSRCKAPAEAHLTFRTALSAQDIPGPQGEDWDHTPKSLPVDSPTPRKWPPR